MSCKHLALHELLFLIPFHTIRRENQDHMVLWQEWWDSSVESRMTYHFLPAAQPYWFSLTIIDRSLRHMDPFSISDLWLGSMFCVNITCLWGWYPIVHNCNNTDRWNSFIFRWVLCFHRKLIREFRQLIQSSDLSAPYSILHSNWTFSVLDFVRNLLFQFELHRLNNHNTTASWWSGASYPQNHMWPELLFLKSWRTILVRNYGTMRDGDHAWRVVPSGPDRLRLDL